MIVSKCLDLMLAYELDFMILSKGISCNLLHPPDFVLSFRFFDHDPNMVVGQAV